MAKTRKVSRSKKSSGTSRSGGGGGRHGWRHYMNRQVLVWCGVIFVVLCTYFLWGMPGADEVKPLETSPSITILASDDTVIARYGGMKGDTVSVKDLPPYVTQAVLAIEDRRFYDHFGVDPIGLARAMAANLMAGHWVQGGSTITQQLAKNLFLSPDKTLRRKVQEALLALQIEYKFTKDEILSAYLNRVYFGAGAYGIDAAARTYYNKSAKNLTLLEGATLAGLLKAPSRFSPAANPERAKERAMVVIHAMEDAEYIDEKRMKKELTQAAAKSAGRETGDLNRYFGDWVINQIDSFVSNNDRDLKVRTTFNQRLQVLAEKRQKELFKDIKPEEKISQAALVTMTMDGAVLAMIGGTDYSASQFNRATQAQRQPGSSFKPFVFLAAMEAGWGPGDEILDAPITSGTYRPDNYENKYYGPVSLTQALAFSLNTATIRLLQEVGMAHLLDVVQRLGFSRKVNPELATGLGASETNLLEMTNAYAVIANGGRAVWPWAVLSIMDSSGNVLYRHESAAPAQVFARRDTAALDSMMVQVVAQGTAQAAQLGSGHVAGKTGTTQNYRDAWFIGYTDRFVTGVWMGNDDNTPMQRVSGGRYPARLWRAYMQDAIGVSVPGAREREESFFSSSIDSSSYGYQPAASSTSGDEGGFSNSFSRMLRQWSDGDRPTPNNKPVYNR